jgi:predicted nucleotidyltransferase component of viral defense system
LNKDGVYLKEQMLELINLTTEQLGLQDPYVVEKDFYVTKAVSVLSNIKSDTFDLIFQGGTALVKAHKIIQRMSEDLDFRLIYKDPAKHKNKSLQRKQLRMFRESILEALLNSDFKLDEGAATIRNEGRFITIRARYSSYYSDTPSALKPYISFEFFLGEVNMPPVEKKITSLIRETLGKVPQQIETSVACMSVLETAAEKWVALTRRVATIKERGKYYKQALVRHLYDLLMINAQQPLDKIVFQKLVEKIIENDRQHFKKHSELYYKSPKEAITYSMNELSNNSIWQTNWDSFAGTMVYGEKPSYKEAIKNMALLSSWICPMDEIQ